MRGRGHTKKNRQRILDGYLVLMGLWKDFHMSGFWDFGRVFGVDGVSARRTLGYDGQRLRVGCWSYVLNLLRVSGIGSFGRCQGFWVKSVRLRFCGKDLGC